MYCMYMRVYVPKRPSQSFFFGTLTWAFSMYLLYVYACIMIYMHVYVCICMYMHVYIFIVCIVFTCVYIDVYECICKYMNVYWSIGIYFAILV